jgi:fatty-acyl-CoA synthase
LALLKALTASARDVRRSLGSGAWRQSVRSELGIIARAARHTAPWLWRSRQRGTNWIDIVLINAREDPTGLAIETEDAQTTWGDLANQMKSVARALETQGVGEGDVVALVATGSPRYIALVLGIAACGAVASLINPHLRGEPLAHAVRASTPRLVIADGARAACLADVDVKAIAPAPLFEGPAEFTPRRMPPNSDFVYIFTSGTTGWPKPCRVTHARALLAGASFGPLVLELGAGDKIYNALPLYHASGLLIAAGSCIVTRTPMFLRPHFSASAFWRDVKRYRCTAFIYIGEMCRYLVSAEPSDDERNNPLRIAAGNGLRADVWERFAERFDIATIREYYGATEAPGALVNWSGEVGSIGRLPLRRLAPMILVRYDAETGDHPRNDLGRCMACGPEEVGELLVKLPEKEAVTAMTDYRGYTDDEASARKILHDVFHPGDRFYRSGDLMRYDPDGFFFFVDRIGDTFRFKGENVSTSEVADVLAKRSGIEQLCVVGVQVPGIEGRAGLAAVVCPDGFDVDSFAKAAADLPGYARPRFVRLLDELPATSTHKIRKVAIADDGVDPTRVDDPIYVSDGDSYVPLTETRWHDIVAGEVRL